ncbi:hypothetical protein KXS11_01645 [Plantibacter flavus]|uniref:hypothetical protein n=1 Tax=Plantibacter flavus TaxID=150123 RepID=UPI003F1691F5
MLRRAVAGLALTALSLGVTVGCSAPPAPVPQATATVEPLFADEQEALTVASAVYGEYLAMRNLIESEGGVGGERLASFVSPALLAAETESLESFYVALGMRATGAVTADSMTLLRLDARPRADGTVMVVSLCEDESGRTVARDDGFTLKRQTDVVRFPYEVTLGVEPGSGTVGPGGYRIVSREAIEDVALCG